MGEMLIDRQTSHFRIREGLGDLEAVGKPTRTVV